MLALMIKDPVVIFAFSGLAILLGICVFYVYYFYKHIKEDQQTE